MINRLLFVLLLMSVSSALIADTTPLTWSELSAGQQQLLKPFSDQWNSLPAPRQQKILKGVERWEKLTPQQRQQFKGRFERWQQLPADRREKVRKQFQRYLAMTPQNRENIRQRYQRFNQLPAAQRQQLRQRWNNLPPKVKRRIIENRRY